MLCCFVPQQYHTIFLGLNIIKLHSHLCNSNCCLVMQRVAIPLVSADLLYQVARVWYCWGTKQQSNKACSPFGFLNRRGCYYFIPNGLTCCEYYKLVSMTSLYYSNELLGVHSVDQLMLMIPLTYYCNISMLLNVICMTCCRLCCPCMLGCIFLFQEYPFLGPCFLFLPGFLRIPSDSCFFPRNFFTGTSFWQG